MAEAIPQVLDQEFDPAVPLDRLTPHPANPNQGDVGLLCELIDANGFAGAVMAQKSTGIIIDGEHRLKAARARGMATIPVLWADVDDDKRDRLLAEWNESTRRGHNDMASLVALLQGLESTPQGLAGTAFDGDALDRMVAELNQPLVIPDAPTEARYAEDEDEAEARRNAIAGYTDRKAGGALAEMILVFTQDDRAEVGRLLDAARAGYGDKDLRGADLMLRGLRVLTAALDGAPKSKPLAKLVTDAAAHPATEPEAEEAPADGDG